MTDSRIGGKMTYAEARELLEKAHPEDWRRLNSKLDASEPARAPEAPDCVKSFAHSRVSGRRGGMHKLKMDNLRVESFEVMAYSPSVKGDRSDPCNCTNSTGLCEEKDGTYYCRTYHRRPGCY